MRRLVQGRVVVIALLLAAVTAHAQAETPDAPPADRVAQLVAALAAPTRAERVAAQEELLALPPEAEPLLARTPPPPGFEPLAALAYVRGQRPRPPKQNVVPAGTWKVGSAAAVDQNPEREVTLASFRIDDVEVTCFEWWRFVRATKGTPPPEWIGGRYRYAGESLPVQSVAPGEAAAFAAWVGGRLPTTDEWEVAAHGGSPRPYPWGEEFGDHFTGSFVRLRQNVAEPKQVASEPDDRSPFGGFDFCGSLMEWVTLPGGRTAARGGHYNAGNQVSFRLTRSPDPNNTRRRTVGLRVVDRRS